jgi:demethylmenaquinone methyltransferase/2-methoxy-6-polyprenyl-1,4-benzoquinol methylase
MGKRSEQVRPYNQDSAKKQQVEQMFDNIAHKYDFLNHFLSLGIDNIWRKRAINVLAKVKAERVLDVATGTGDLAFAAANKMPGIKITGVDISKGMLEIGKQKAVKKGLTERIEFKVADSENLPFESYTFDAVMVAFGVRNFENLEKGLQEMNRVLKPGGTIIVLEFSKPRVFPVKQLFGIYFRYILPLIGKFTSKDPKAYKYLFESVQAFPDFGDFADVMENSGFNANKWRALTLGICSLYTGVK